eukprot:TRINITY_DN3505_c1_g2_i4.p1 TRINITY_DN3505_c1_g2~~TRINITY_DN3505_c1_g2_i4.p1  ORF type:complete len:1295 (-),score=522.47 TRINITY_DN3505_c1_g2_i4:122-4006(-)
MGGEIAEQRANYLSTDASTSELVKRLKKVAEKLKNVEQEAEDKGNWEATAAALVQIGLIKHKDKDVQLLTACCLAEIIRIFAPEPPYDDKKLKDVLKLFVEQLGLLKNIDSPIYERVYNLLEQLTVIKVFALLGDLDEEGEIASSLMKKFFSTVTDKHSNSVKTHIIDIASTLIEESSSISQNLLDSILINLIGSAAKKENPVPYRLAQLIVNKCAPVLHPSITEFLQDAKSSDSELKDHVHELIFELNRISSDFLFKVFPVLERELRSENLPTKLAANGLLARLFAAKGSNLASNYKLFSAFLLGFHDTEEKIRNVMLQFARHYMANQSQNLEMFTDPLIARLQDVNEEIRKLAVTTVCQIGVENIQNLNGKLVSAVIERLRDKKPDIRKEAVVQLCAMYAAVRKQFPDENDHQIEKVHGIPSAILSCYHFPDIEDRLRVEKEFDKVLLSDAADAKIRADRLVEIVNYLLKEADTEKQFKENQPLAALLKLLKDKRSFQVEFEKLLNAKEKGVDTAPFISLCSHRFSGSTEKVRDFVSSVAKTKEEKTLKRLRSLLDYSAPYSQLKTIRNEVVKKYETKHKKSAERATRRLIPSIINAESVELILGSALKSNAKSEGIVYFLTEVSQFMPDSFNSNSLDLLQTVLTEKKKPKIIDQVLSILANVSSQFSAEDVKVTKKLKEKLTELCVTGTPFQAKKSVVVLSRLFKKPADIKTQLSMLLETNVIKKLDAKEKNLETILTTAAAIAKQSPSIFQSSKDEILPFIVKFFQKEGVKKKVGSDLVNAKVAGLKVLSNYLVGLEDITQGDEVLTLLFKFVEHRGDLTKKETSDKAEREKMRLNSAKALISVAKHRRSVDLFSPERFELFATIMQDTSKEVRKEFLEKVLAGLRSLKLPLQYLSLPVLCATDSSQDIRALARSELTLNIKTRREWCKINAEKLVSGMQIRFLPEFALGHLVHLIAHLEDLEDDQKALDNQGQKYLSFFFEHLFHGDNFIMLRNILSAIKSTKDVFEPSSRNTHRLADIGFQIVNAKSESRHWQQKKEAVEEIYLPTELYQVPTEKEMLAFQNSSSAPFQLGNKEESSKTKKSSKNGKDEEENDEEPKATKKRKNSTKSNKKKVEEEEEEEEELKVNKKKSKKANKDEEKDEEEELKEETKKSKGKPASKKREKAVVEEEETPEEVTKTPRGKKASPKATSSSKKQKRVVEEEEEEEVEPSPSKKRKGVKAVAEAKKQAKEASKKVEEETEEQPAKSKKGTTKGRKGSKKAQVEPEEEEEENSEPPQLQRKTSGRKARK